LNVNKTRQELVSAARKLFGKTGLKNTTMHDIAVESRKGRRTLYTYFKNKNEILDAVIAEEMEYVIKAVEKVVYLDLDPVEKFITYVITRMNTVREVVARNGSLHADFFMDVVRVELVRRKMEKLEVGFIETIFQEGCDSNLFHFEDVKQAAIFGHFVMRGIEVPYIRGIFDEPGKDRDESLRRKTMIILYGLLNSDQIK
jgi:AcrR family transcriptional regulator